MLAIKGSLLEVELKDMLHRQLSKHMKLEDDAINGVSIAYDLSAPRLAVLFVVRHGRFKFHPKWTVLCWVNLLVYTSLSYLFAWLVPYSWLLQLSNSLFLANR